MNVSNRTIFQGDNLGILRGIDSECIDLIYLDPPFNSNRTYEAPIGSEAAGAAFKDAWTLSDVDNAWHGEISEHEPALYSAIAAAGETHGKSMKAYLIMMAIRMLEMHRILKPTGSIYLHCDPTASHYLKTIMDSIFGQQNFRNEIVWRKYGGRKNNAKRKFSTQQDTIFLYTKSKNAFFQPVFLPISEKEIEKEYRHTDEQGRRYRLSRGRHYQMTGVQRRIYLDEQPGAAVGSLWVENGLQLNTSSSERVGYPTQKPLALLQRIIKASSRRSEVVLDPFCGCATTCIAAESLQRQWVGIDISPKAIELLKLRIERQLDLTENTGILGKVIHRTEPPQRTDLVEARQIHFEGLFGVKDQSLLSNLSERDLWRFKTHKHVMFGMQEGKCAGCRSEYHFRNLTIDHREPRSKGGSDQLQNLQLLCNWCNSVKGDRSQDYLNRRLREEGILR